jgi:Domain of unknown function (DUF4331)
MLLGRAPASFPLTQQPESIVSHHLDSPIARQDVRLDITDLYVFRGEIGTVFVINICHSIAGNIPVPGYHPEGMYEFKIDLNGDVIEELTYRFTFDERDKEGRPRSSPPTARPRTRRLMPRRSRIAFSRMCCRTQWAHRLCSASPNGTAVRSRTTHPM